MSITIEQLAAAKTCIVAGSGRQFYAELAAAQALGRADVMAVNFAACFVEGPCHHVASLHYHHVGAYRDCRAGLPHCDHQIVPETHGYREHPGVDRVWTEWDTEEGRWGTSSLFAVRVALALGYERVILAGVPLDDAGAFYDPPGFPPNPAADYRTVRPAWRQAAKTWFEGRVTAVGQSWTAELVGAP